MLAQILGLDHAFNYIMNGVILAMVGLGILNTILMRVLERRYEFGVSKALGLRPRQLAVMVVGESLALTAMSLALGLVVGLERTALLRHHRTGSALGIHGGASTRTRFRSYSLLAPERGPNRLVRQHRIRDGYNHFVLSRAQGSAYRPAAMP